MLLIWYRRVGKKGLVGGTFNPQDQSINTKLRYNLSRDGECHDIAFGLIYLHIIRDG